MAALDASAFLLLVGAATAAKIILIQGGVHEIVRRLGRIELEPWVVDAIDAIIKGGKKKEE